jgi:tetratricopeptide (TPR) repeat protein
MGRSSAVCSLLGCLLISTLALAQDPQDMNARFENLRAIQQFGRSKDMATMREGLFAVLPAEVVSYNKIPGKARSYFEHGNEALQKREYQKAKEQYESAIGVYPEFALAHHNLAVAAIGLKDPERAQAELQAAIKNDPQMVVAYQNLAVLEINAENPGAALENLQTASRLDPKDPKTLTLLAYCQAMTHHLEEAVATARRVHSLKDHAGYAYAHMVAGTALESLGQKEEAIKEYKQFIAEDPKDPRTAVAKQQIAALQQAH